jgi:hypothetical protein
MINVLLKRWPKVQNTEKTSKLNVIFFVLVWHDSLILHGKERE